MSSFHTYSSWGRTRRPKNLQGRDSSSAVVVLAHGATPSGITATNGSAGYPTENQRYLVVTVDNDGNSAPGRDIEIWVYMHASGVWTQATDLTIDCSGITSNAIYKIEIAGVDRVAFVRDAGAWSAEPTAVYASCSTF